MIQRNAFRAACYGPDDLTMISSALEDAWATVAPDFDEDPVHAEEMRRRLAKALLAEASQGLDRERLRASALRAVRRSRLREVGRESVRF